VESKDDVGQTPLLLAARNGHEVVMKLLEKGVDVKSKNGVGQTRAVRGGYKAARQEGRRETSTFERLRRRC